MKKLLVIVVLGLLLSVNAFASDIKIKRIECKNPKDENLFKSKFIIIANNGTKAKWLQSRSKYSYIEKEYKVTSGVHYIYFYNVNDELNPIYRIIRSSGELKKGWSGSKLFGICDKMPENFNPKTYFYNQTMKNRAEKKESDKF